MHRRACVMVPALVIAGSFMLISCGRSRGKTELSLLDSFLPGQSDPSSISLNIRIRDFQAKHPEVTLIRDQSSFDKLDARVPVLGSAGQLPDLFVARSSWIPKLADAGKVLPVETLMKDNKAFLDGFIPGMLNDFQYKDAHFGIPWQAVPVSLLYQNMDLLRKAGIAKVPDTLNDLLAAVKALRGKGITPIAMGGRDARESRLLFSGLNVRTAGADWLEKLKSAQMKFTDPPFQTTVAVFDVLARAGAWNKDFAKIDAAQARAMYLRQKVAMYNETAAFALTEDDQWPAELKRATRLSVFPRLPGEDLSAGVTLPVTAGRGIAFSSRLSGDKLRAARWFAVEVLGDDYTRALEARGGIGVRKVDGVDFSRAPEVMKRYFDELAPKVNAGGHIDERMPSSVTDAVSASLQSVMLGQESAAAALQDIQAALEKSGTVKSETMRGTAHQ
ncbi:MAG TPA: extracellular solute-binding protein [Spirochaetia bacterium]|nr:extracellular solute-binding protein [Spirochaetia bacterium]